MACLPGASVSCRYPKLVLLLDGILVSVLIGKSIGEHRFAVEQEQAPTAEPPALSDNDAVGATLGHIDIGAYAE